MDIFELLFSPLFLLPFAIITLILGLLLGVELAQPRKNRILKISPESQRGIDYEVERFDEVNAYCKPVGNSPPQRFIKINEGYNIVKKGLFRLHTYALWVARTGSAYTTAFALNMESTPLEITLAQAIKNLLGDLYKKLPQNTRTTIEENKLSVMVKFPTPPLSPTVVDSDGKKIQLPTVNSDDITTGDDEKVMHAWAVHANEGAKGGIGMNLTTILLIIGMMGCGVVVGIIFQIGWPKIPSTTG